MRFASVVLVVAFLAAACSGQTTDGVDDLPDVTLDNVDVGGDITTFIPSGWILGAEGLGVPPANSDLGPITWQIDDACGERCGVRSAAEWSGVADSFEFGPLGNDAAVVRRAESSANRRLVEYVDDAGVLTVRIARWVDGASAYLRCELVGPAEELVQLAPAFEFACDNTRAALAG